MDVIQSFILCAAGAMRHNVYRIVRGNLPMEVGLLTTTRVLEQTLVSFSYTHTPVVLAWFKILEPRTLAVLFINEPRSVVWLLASEREFCSKNARRLEIFDIEEGGSSLSLSVSNVQGILGQDQGSSDR